MLAPGVRIATINHDLCRDIQYIHTGRSYQEERELVWSRQSPGSYCRRNAVAAVQEAL